jgi:hypothetical protein
MASNQVTQWYRLELISHATWCLVRRVTALSASQPIELGKFAMKERDLAILFLVLINKSHKKKKG